MKKKGFTLVELLAVIAILAILVILALPNVMNMYVRAKKNTFLTEAQNVLKESSNKFIQEGMSGNKINVVSNSKNPLNLTGEKIKNYISEEEYNNIQKMRKENKLLGTIKGGKKSATINIICKDENGHFTGSKKR